MIDKRWALGALVFLSLILMTGCAVADDPADERPAPDPGDRPAGQLLETPNDPQPVELPEDAGPHDRLTEWWYYTGHVEDANSNLYGFEFVIFQALRGEFPPIYASHFAITDTTRGEFHYAERVESFTPGSGEDPLDLDVGGWTLQGGDGTDRIVADMDGYELEIELNAAKPPVLHEGNGFFEFAPGSASYYYSRTRMDAEGTLTIDGDELDVTGSAWFDQQWGDFLVLGGEGWDWFSIQLDNNQELMAWQSHDGEGTILDGNATIVREDGEAIDVPSEALSIEPLDEWESHQTGGVYPMVWSIRVESHDIDLIVEPVMEDQELITLESTGVVYWEGMVRISGDWEGAGVEGLGYVELTGYAKVEAEGFAP
ncbi:MAG: lipocalin-like domain-containing protein [Thermomicrobiaceae bacterium]